jgi:hypothetical protein
MWLGNLANQPIINDDIYLPFCLNFLLCGRKRRDGKAVKKNGSEDKKERRDKLLCSFSASFYRRRLYGCER